MLSERRSTRIGSVISTAVITALVGAAFAWGATLTKKIGDHDRDIAVQKEAQAHVVKDIDDIKSSQRRVEDKLDRVLERRQ